MAERRMFTKKVTDDDNFTSLSASAQALYLHLAMSADDDGFSNQITVSMFRAHASPQDLKSLLEKRYILQFKNGVIVIKHWRMANALRRDRYTPTAYQEELAQLGIKENGSYTDNPDGCRLVANWLPDGCQVVATGKDRLGEVSIDKDSVGKDSEEDSLLSDRFNQFWSSYPKKTGKGAAIKSWSKIAPNEELFTRIMDSLEAHKASDQWHRQSGQFIPNPSTWLNQMRWEDEVQVDTAVETSNPFLAILKENNGL